jgi:hypothetical protein
MSKYGVDTLGYSCGLAEEAASSLLLRLGKLLVSNLLKLQVQSTVRRIATRYEFGFMHFLTGTTLKRSNRIIIQNE